MATSTLARKRRELGQDLDALLKAPTTCDLSPEADARDSVRLDRKFALLDAAAALPVGGNAAQRAKALALAWDYSVDVWRPKLTREQHKRDGRLVIDLMSSLTGKASTSLATNAQITGPETPHLDLSGYTVAQLCALFDVYERAEDQFHTAAWWPKLGAAGSQRVTDEGDRCSTLKGAVADELQKRKPGRESDADERAEKLLRREIVKGDWDATAHLACSLRNEVVACQGKH